MRRTGDRVDHRRGGAGRLELPAAARRHPGARPSCATLDQLLPPSGPILDALARFDPLPSVRGPAADVPAPTRRILASRACPGRAAAAWCGCSGRRAGSAWRAAAGWRPRTWSSPTRTSSPARATPRCRSTGWGGGCRPRRSLFDPHNDVAILRRPRALAAGAADRRRARSPGTAAAILGYPLDGPFDAEPGRLGQTETVSTQNAYGQGHVMRSIAALRGRVRPGTRAARWSTTTGGARHRVRGAHGNPEGGRLCRAQRARPSRPAPRARPT